ncbi:hypothetical protein Tco_1308973 [Tanacetum coccineum]
MVSKGIEENGINDEIKVSDNGKMKEMNEGQMDETSNECNNRVEGDMITQNVDTHDYNERTHSNKPNKVKPTPMQVNVQPSVVKTCVGVDDYNKSYADKVSNGVCEENKLNHIPTMINENGQEFVIFDDELVSEGSKK